MGYRIEEDGYMNDKELWRRVGKIDRVLIDACKNNRLTDEEFNEIMDTLDELYSGWRTAKLRRRLDMEKEKNND